MEQRLPGMNRMPPCDEAKQRLASERANSGENNDMNEVQQHFSTHSTVLRRKGSMDDFTAATKPFFAPLSHHLKPKAQSNRPRESQLLLQKSIRLQEELVNNQLDKVIALRVELAARELTRMEMSLPCDQDRLHHDDLVVMKNLGNIHYTVSQREQYVSNPFCNLSSASWTSNGPKKRPQETAHHVAGCSGYSGSSHNSADDEHSRSKKTRLLEPLSPQKKKAKKPVIMLAPNEGLPLVVPTDKGLLSGYQLMIRESLEFFQVQPIKVHIYGTQGRKGIEPGQVGLRCKYCAHRPLHWRGRAAVYFPRSIGSVYQAAQNMANNHLLKYCDDMPGDIKENFAEARRKQMLDSRRSGGKSYWSETCFGIGLGERDDVPGVWFCSTI